MTDFSNNLKSFASDFRDGLIGLQPEASRGMCAMVSVPLRAALKVMCEIDTDLVTEDGHTFLVTIDRQLRIDPTIDQFQSCGNGSEKVLVEIHTGGAPFDERLRELPFVELIEHFKRLYSSEGLMPDAKAAGEFVAKYIYYPLAQQGFFENRKL